jgi:hypothetical protein
LPWLEEPDVPDPNGIDPERLAALIDGRLGRTEAAEVRALLANADADTLAAYADAVAVADALREPGAAAPTADVRPIASVRSTPRWLYPMLGAVAAGLVGIAVLRTSMAPPSTVVADVTGGLTAAPLGVPEWNAVRSSDGALTDRGRAVRMGVLLVQYEFAARRGDSAAASRAAMITALLDGVPGGSAAAMRWREVAGRARQPDQQARAADVSVAQSLVDPELVRLGAWLESARAAAAVGQAAWFDANDATPVARAAKSGAATPGEREALAAVERAMKGRPLDLAAVSATIIAAERVLAR